MQVRRKLKHNCAAIQYPIGLEDQLQGLVDLVQNRAFFFHGVHGCVPEIAIV
jgi:elongation factor G